MKNKNWIRRACLLAGTITTICAWPALAGPPLATDDAGILDPGQFEIIVAAALENTNAGDSTELPLFDISYGVSENVQVSVVYAYVDADPDVGPSESEFGNPEFGAKYRFLNTGRWQLAVAPAYAFGVSQSTADKGIGSENDTLYVPLLAEYTMGAWRINGELGYNSIEKEPDEWSYGVSAAYAASENTELLAELYGGANDDFDQSNLNFSVGLDHAVTDAWHLLVSVGSGLNEPTGADEVDLTAFIGVQYFTD